MKTQVDCTGKYGIVGNSPGMQAVYDRVEKAGRTRINILLQGESGTGKELVARALHGQLFGRSNPFESANCATIPKDLHESELFGHEKGAFTGAEKKKRGYFERAHEGTLYLDEIGKASLPLQAKLLRVLDYSKGNLREYKPVGAEKTQTSNFRLITGSSANLKELVRTDEFSHELFYRIAKLCINLPPLREREGDIDLLTDHFIQKYQHEKTFTITPEARASLREYYWPGNVRQLESVIEVAMTLADPTTNTLTKDNIEALIQDSHIDLPNLASEPGQTGDALFIPPKLLTELRTGKLEGAKEELERFLAISRLARAHGSIIKAAEDLGLDRASFYRLRERFGLLDKQSKAA